MRDEVMRDKVTQDSQVKIRTVPKGKQAFKVRPEGATSS